MNITIRKINGEGFLTYNNVDAIKMDKSCDYILSIDPSSTCTGISILRLDDGKPEWSIAIKREDDENKTRYKIRLKSLIVNVLHNNSNIKYIEYEEPFIEYAESASVLYGLAPLVEELIIENEPDFNHIKSEFVSNKKWKKALLDGKVPVGSAKEKEAVTQYVVRMYSQFANATQDERDALGLAISKYRELNGLVQELESLKVRKFKYEVEFIGGELIDEAIEHIRAIGRIPRLVIDNGMTYTEMRRGDKFDDVILRAMRNDDIVCVIAFDTNVAGNLYVKYKLASLKKYPKVYAIVWRSNRKKA